jgi:hypothetical protein
MLARLTGKTLPADREWLVTRANSVLQLMWRTPSTLQLHFRERGCSVARMFTESCLTCSTAPRQFAGVVLPPNVMNVTELMADYCPFEITNEPVPPQCLPWGSWVNHGAGQPLNPRAEIMPARLLEAQIPLCNDSRRVTFQSDSPLDCGKPVGTEYTELTGRPMREDVILAIHPVATSMSVAEFSSITFPDRCGWITVATEDGAILGRYHPSVYVPRHEWFRLEVMVPGWRVQWRGVKEPIPLVFDSDTVPFADEPMWRLALQADKYLDQMDLTDSQSQHLSRIYATLGRMTDADMDAAKKNFNIRMMPMGSHAALSTARAFTRPTGRRAGW